MVAYNCQVSSPLCQLQHWLDWQATKVVEEPSPGVNTESVWSFEMGEVVSGMSQNLFGKVSAEFTAVPSSGFNPPRMTSPTSELKRSNEVWHLSIWSRVMSLLTAFFEQNLSPESQQVQTCDV